MRIFVAKYDALRLPELNGREELTDVSGTRHRIGAIISVVYEHQNDNVFILFTSDGEVSTSPEPVARQQQQLQGGWQGSPQGQPYRPQQQYPQPQPGWQQPWGGGGAWNGVVQ